MKKNYTFQCSYKENGVVKNDGVITIYDASSKEEAGDKVENACKKLLANPIMEGYQYEIFQE